jgi:hypothetical protein
LMMYESKAPVTRFAGLAIFLPFPYLAQLAGIPWAMGPSLVVVAALGAVVWEAMGGLLAERRRPALGPAGRAVDAPATE